jgi:hypothetical protein
MPIYWLNFGLGRNKFGWLEILMQLIKIDRDFGLGEYWWVEK